MEHGSYDSPLTNTIALHPCPRLQLNPCNIRMLIAVQFYMHNTKVGGMCGGNKLLYRYK